MLIIFSNRYQIQFDLGRLDTILRYGHKTALCNRNCKPICTDMCNQLCKRDIKSPLRFKLESIDLDHMKGEENLELSMAYVLRTHVIILKLSDQFFLKINSNKDNKELHHSLPELYTRT